MIRMASQQSERRTVILPGGSCAFSALVLGFCAAGAKQGSGTSSRRKSGLFQEVLLHVWMSGFAFDVFKAQIPIVCLEK